MFDGHHQIVCELLTARRLVEPALLQAAWAEHQTTGKSFAAVLLERGGLAKSTLLRAVAEHLGLEYRATLPAPLPPAALALLDANLARSHGVLPVAADVGVITVAASNPFSLSLVPDLVFALGRDVRVVVADPDAVGRLIGEHYGTEPDLAAAASEPLAAAGGDVGAETTYSTADLEEMAGQSHIIHFVNLVLAQAIRDKASDIHFEPFEQDFKIRSRIDGTLYEMAPPPKTLALPIVSRLKVLANLDIAERRLPQDGRIKLNHAGRAVDLRISTLPTQFGESVVLRVLDQSAIRLALSQLGLPGTIRSRIEQIIHRPNGIFIATGPTGSGKTTTLYSCLQELNSIEAKLLTVEDPVEYEIDGVMQVPVNLPAGLGFARVLRAFLRQDPDIVMVGEIRDLETAQIAVQASLTGHLVLTTLHTNDAPGVVPRLVDMGIEPFLLASTLEGVLAQRLLRRVCPECKIACEPAAATLRSLGVSQAALQGRPVYRAPGCPACHQTGFKGRLGIFEFLRLTDPLRELLVQRASVVQLRQAAEGEGMTSLREAGVQALAAGETTVDEVLKYT